jgi:hypothetical protein
MLIDAVGKLLGGGLARAARDYINIIGGFIGQEMRFCAALQWCALRTHLHLLLFLKTSKPHRKC